MEAVLYFKMETELPDQEEKLRIEIRGMPDRVEKLIKIIREEIAKWEYWRET